jgi:hypothetical protein
MLETTGEELIETPAGVQLHTCISPATSQDITIVINHTRTARTIELPWAAREYLSGKEIGKELSLPGYGVAVVTRREAENS